MAQFAIILGNMVKGFHVIGGFGSEEQAHNFATENRTALGSEVRFAPIVDKGDLPRKADKVELQDKLLFEPARPGEVVDENTGASVDVIDRKVVEDAAEPTNHIDPDRAGESGSGSSGDDAELPGLSGPGGTVSGSGADTPADSIGSRGGSSGGGAESVIEPASADDKSAGI